MKIRIISLAVVAVLIYSCAAKSSAPTADGHRTEGGAPIAGTRDTPPPAPVAIATVMTPELAEGKNLYENNCAKCHRLYEAHSFSAEEWKPIVASMQKKAHLDDLQGQKIYNYLTMK